MIGCVKNGGGASMERRCDDGLNDNDCEERGLCSELRPDDGCSNCREGKQEREPTQPRLGELIGCLCPLGERLRMDADLDVFAEDGDLLAQIEPAAELVDGCMSLG